MAKQKLKGNWNGNVFELSVWKSSENNSYIVDLNDNVSIPIEIVKDALEDFLNIEIKQYSKGGHKRYAKDNFEPSNEFSYWFSCEE